MISWKSGRDDARAARRAFALFSLTAFGAALGCSPAIKEFDVSPPVLCEGDRALIRWVTRGDPVIAYQPEASPGGIANCGGHGRQATAFTLAARSGSREVERRIEVIQLAASGSEPIALRANAVEGSEVVASGDKDAALWRAKVTITTIAACHRRAITVRHAGRIAMLAADGTPSAVLDGTAIGGAWELRSPLSIDEQKEPGLRPSELDVIASFRCQAAGP